MGVEKAWGVLDGMWKNKCNKMDEMRGTEHDWCGGWKDDGGLRVQGALGICWTLLQRQTFWKD